MGYRVGVRFAHGVRVTGSCSSCHTVTRVSPPACGGETMTVLPIIEFLESRVLLPDRLPPSGIGNIPVDRVVQRLAPVTAWSPTQLVRDARRVDGIASIVTRPILDMANERPRFAELFENGMHDVQVLPLVVGG